ncbi:hypothetical protein IG631_18509 [Alternaria alternata]|nr:hypothetical protein IG631_18509 [Alternaria alternata]
MIELRIQLTLEPSSLCSSLNSVRVLSRCDMFAPSCAHATQAPLDYCRDNHERPSPQHQSPDKFPGTTEPICSVGDGGAGIDGSVSSYTTTNTDADTYHAIDPI